jgi:hypothetical protein
MSTLRAGTADRINIAGLRDTSFRSIRTRHRASHRGMEKIRTMGNSAYGPESIRIIDNSAYTPKVIPTYVALGFLDEYLGRGIVEDGERVESFYPNEQAQAEHFISILEDVDREKDIVTNIRQEVGRQGHISIISRELTGWLDSLYLPRFDGGMTLTGVDGMKRRSTKAYVRAEMFPAITSREYRHDEVDCRFSFLLGCHFRYGRNNALTLFNAKHKVELLIEFLEQLGAPWIRWSWTTRIAPRNHVIEFGPDPVLTKVLGLS